MTRPDLSQMTSEEKDALILALLQRIEELEARLGGGPPKTPDNSSVPPSRGQKRNRPPRQKKPRKTRDGPGTTRTLTLDARVRFVPNDSRETDRARRSPSRLLICEPRVQD
ncbi:DUF6444 domain-containing protein [Rhodospira trueperi]|uniref:DUF6444 domain-containing protein n=1 Tax=Rhodospira trueperi TaxID=69960 RepID=A0A1G7I2X1_9PROT|nr:DUF6444 domain-containing protein [Rhodospira trueperi]SDF07100.1 hypothetical protein SAMN05421720_12913 [Rhodospira trueperi]